MIWNKYFNTNSIIYLYLIIENELLSDNKVLSKCKGSVAMWIKNMWLYLKKSNLNILSKK